MTIPPQVCFGYAVTGHVAGKDGRKLSFDPRTHQI
jgi:hypothetical protein